MSSRSKDLCISQSTMDFAVPQPGSLNADPISTPRLVTRRHAHHYQWQPLCGEGSFDSFNGEAFLPIAAHGRLLTNISYQLFKCSKIPYKCIWLLLLIWMCIDSVPRSYCLVSLTAPPWIHCTFCSHIARPIPTAREQLSRLQRVKFT